MQILPEARTMNITPEKLLSWTMKLVGVDQSHYQRSLKLTRFFENQAVNRSPQSVAAAIIYQQSCICV